MALHPIMIKPSLTATSGAQSNATATATIAAPAAGRKVFITGFSAGFDTAVTKLLVITDGVNVTLTIPIVNAFGQDFGSPIECAPAKSVTATLPASGGGNGVVNLKYYTA